MLRTNGLTPYRGLTALTFLSSLLLVACDDGAAAPDDAGPPLGDGGPPVGVDAGPPDAPLVDVEGALLDATWGALAAGDTAGPVGLVRRDDGLYAVSRYRDLAVSGPSTEGSIATAPDGSVCALWREEDDVVVGCAPDFAIDLRYVADGQRYQLAARAEWIKVYYQQRTSAHALVEVEGALIEEEQFESSVSYFGDAASGGGVASACLVASTDEVTLSGALGGSPHAADDCAVTFDGARAGVLAIATADTSYGRAIEVPGLGVAALGWATVTAGGALTAGRVGDHVLIVRALGGRASAIALRDVVEELDMAGSTPRASLTPTTITEGPLAAVADVDQVTAARAVSGGGSLSVLVEGTVGAERRIREAVIDVADLPTTPFGADDPFVRVDVPGDVYYADAAGGVIWFVAGSRVYRVEAGVEREVGTVSLNPLYVVADADGSAVVGDTRDAAQWAGDTVEAPVMIGSAQPLRAQGGWLYATTQHGVSQCVDRFRAGANELAGCYGTGARVDHLFLRGAGDADDLALVGRQLRASDQVLLTTLPANPTEAQEAPGGSPWVAAGNAVYRYDGAEWQSVGTFEGTVRHLAALSDTEVWAHIGGSATLERYDGTAWETVDPGVDVTNLRVLAGDPVAGAVLVADRRIYIERQP